MNAQYSFKTFDFVVVLVVGGCGGGGDSDSGSDCRFSEFLKIFTKIIFTEYFFYCVLLFFLCIYIFLFSSNVVVVVVVFGFHFPFLNCKAHIWCQ